MKTPYGLLPGTHRTTRRGLFPCDIVEYVGPSSVRVQWYDDRDVTTIPTNRLDCMPQAGNAPHGLNAGTLRAFKEGGYCRVVRYVSGALVLVTTQDATPHWIRPSTLMPIQD
jgi:hypothetical protein